MTLPGLVAASNLSDVVDRERAWDNLGSSVSTNIPISSPSLDLNFAANKSLVDDISGNNLITFSRASTGTFVGSDGLIQTAASGVPRFDHNGATGESLGLLIEEARTNLLLRSEEFNTTWASSSPTISPNIAISPDGTATADKIITSNTNAQQRIFQNVTIPTETLTFSVYAKAAGFSYMRLESGASAAIANFDLIQGVLGFVSGAATISKVGNGWYRCSMSITASAGTVDFRIYIIGSASDARGSTLAGNGTDGIFVWGAQVEAGAFPTSYIPTVASTITRAADVASIAGANFSSWYNQSQGTLVATTPSGIQTSGNNQSYFGISINALQANISTGNGIKYGNGSPSTNTRFQVVTASAVQVDSISTTNASKIAFAYATNNFALARGGSLFADTLGDVPTGMNTFTMRGIGSQSYSRIAFYPVRLADVALQFITSASGSPSSTTYPYTFAVKGKDTLALNECKNASVRDFVFIKGLSASAQSRLTTIAQQVASGTAFQDAAMLKASPTTIGNYLFSSGVTLSGVSTRINNTQALSIATSPFSGSTATASILLRELQPQANWRITEPMPSGTIASPEFAIPFETNDFLLFMKAGQN
jgi:hypothetical protein